MKRETYAAARTISPKLHAYFARHREAAIRRGQEHLAPLPDAETIEAIIDAAFWASLRREEAIQRESLFRSRRAGGLVLRSSWNVLCRSVRARFRGGPPPLNALGFI